MKAIIINKEYKNPDDRIGTTRKPRNVHEYSHSRSYFIIKHHSA